MRLADRSVPKIKTACTTDDGGLCYCPLEEGVKAFLADRAGKALFVSDRGAADKFAAFAQDRRAICLVSESDALPLFFMPDSVSCVLAVGGKEILCAARFFAELRHIPCLLFPTDAALYGVFGKSGEVTLGSERSEMPLAEGAVCVDLALVSPSLPRAYAGLLLSRLAIFETRVTRLLRKETGSFEEAYAILAPIGELTPAEIVDTNARVRELEFRGLPAGEGKVLSRLYGDRGGSMPEWRAFRELTALYAALLSKGRPRRYFVPDYAARAVNAEIPYWKQTVPTREEYAALAIAFERARAGLYAELCNLAGRMGTYERALRAYAPLPRLDGDLQTLKILPEHAPGGLCAIARDFGLMEW